MVVFLEGSPISTEELWSSVSDHQVLTKVLLPRLLSLAGWPALGRVMVINLGNLAQICASKQAYLGALRTIPFDLMAWFLL